MKLDIDHSLAADLDLGIAIHHPIVTPDDPDSWMRDLCGGTVVATDEMTTDLGWPFVLAHGVATSPDGEIVEHRVGGFYRFFHFVAAVVARAATADELSQKLQAITAVARTARPDFRGQAVALSALWAGSMPIVIH